jgi:hypothetical protein
MMIFSISKQQLLDAIEAEQEQDNGILERTMLHGLYWNIYNEVTLPGMENTLARFLLKFKGETNLGSYLP